MALPSLQDLAKATKTPLPEAATKPAQGDAFERLAAERAATRESLRLTGARREAAKMAVMHFPDATPDQLVPIAKEFEAKLVLKSDPAYLAEQEKIKERNQVDAAGEIMGQSFPLIGGVAGSILGPGGAVVGAGIGGAVQSLHNKIMGKDVTPGSALRNIRNQASYEALGFGAADATLGAMARFFRGNKQTADAISAAFGQVGIRPALQDISDRFWTEGARTVLGALPFANRPFKRRAAQVSREFTTSLDSFISDVSPEIAQVRRLHESDPRAAAALKEELSSRAFQQLGTGVEVLQRERDLAFVNLRRAVEQAEARAADSGISLASPSLNSRAAIGEVAQRFGERTVIRADGTEIPFTPALRDTADFIRDIANNVVARDMTFSEYRALKGRIRDQIATVEDDATASSMLVLLQNGVEQDMVQAARMSPQVWDAYQEAMGISEEFLTLLQGTVSRRMRGVQKTFGRQGAQTVVAGTGEEVLKDAGRLDLSHTVDILSRSASPNEIRQFRGALARGVGEPTARETMSIALGKKLTEAVETAFKESAERSGDAAYVPGVLLQKLGLDTPSSKQYETTVALFEAAGIPVERAIATSRVLDALFSVKNPRVAQMLARQTTLGGARTLIRSLSAGAVGGAAAKGAAGFGALHAASLWFLTRSYGKWVTSPSRARAVVAMADARLPQHARTRAAISVFTDPAIWSDPEDEVQDETLKEIQKSIVEDLRTQQGQARFLNSVDNYLAAGKEPK